MTNRALIIDDNVALAENLREVLEDEGIETVIAPDGPSGLRLCEQVRPNVVITDMRMPGMTGVEVLNVVRARWPQVPVVLITAYTRDCHLDEALASGVLGILKKPVDLEALIGLVQRATTASGRVLVVDDDPAVRSTTVEALQTLDGVVPCAAADCAEARRIVLRTHVAAAIIDVRLPDGDGLALADELERLAGHPICTLVVSGHDDVRRASTTVVAKPVNLQWLVETVKRAL